MKDIPIHRLYEVLDYNSVTGMLTWKKRPSSMFTGGKYSAERRAKSWNSRCAGKPALNCLRSDGYREGSIDNILVLAHRVVWAMHNGAWPKNDIDHKDGKQSRNVIDNLRDVSTDINLKNAIMKSNNISGHTGVSFRKDRGTWRARLMTMYKEVNIGTFPTRELAIHAIENAKIGTEFTARHGKPVHLVTA